MKAEEDVSRLVRELYSLVRKFEALYPERRFTPDGHLVGSIGEVLAACRYDLQLLSQSAEGHDARARDGRYVQVKATQRSSIGLRSEPEHLLVLKLNPDGSAEEVFNGPGQLAWERAGKRQSNGQKRISLSKLKEIMQGVERENMLPVVNA